MYGDGNLLTLGFVGEMSYIFRGGHTELLVLRIILLFHRFHSRGVDICHVQSEGSEYGYSNFVSAAVSVQAL